MGTEISNLERPKLKHRWTSEPQDSTKFFPLARLRKLRDCEQVAAVCYRLRNGTIEFLLVRTRGGRWIFPKGNVEAGLTHAQSAALEAYEEAGVHGRMEEASFTRYKKRKSSSRNFGARASDDEPFINAHLCEVARLGAPQEVNRNPTWFPVEKAKHNLRDDRSKAYGAELTKVIDRAVARIRRLGHEDFQKIEIPRNLRFINTARPRLLER